MSQLWTEHKLKIIIGLGLAVITLGVFFRVLSCDFLNYDDNLYVTQNHFVKEGITRHGLRIACTKVYSCNWHPLTWMSHMLDVQLYGLKPAGHHLTNLLLHTANVVLLFGLLQKITGGLWRSAIVAGLFAWHPLHVESVAWVAERKDVLSTFFGLLCLCAYAGYVRKSRAQGSRPKVLYACALVCFALGLLSKPMLVTLPFLMLLLDYWPLERMSAPKTDGAEKGATLRRLIVEKLPFFVLSALVCLITYYAQHRSGAMELSETIPLGSRIENALVAYVRYLELMVWPANLSVFYPHPHTTPVYQAVAAGLVLAVATAFALLQARRRPWILMGWLWFLGMLVPVIGLVQVGAQAMADRYTYFSLVGPFIALVWGGAELAARWDLPKPVVAALAGVILAGYGLGTVKELSYWRNTGTIFTRALEVTQGNFVAHNNLGIVLYERGQREEAERHFLEAIRINPEFPDAHCNLANTWKKLGKREQAVAEYETALRLEPNNSDFNYDFAYLLLSLGRFKEAAPHFAAAIPVKGGEPQFRYDYGLVLEQLGRFDDAIRQLNAAVPLKPDYAEAHQALGRLLAITGRLDAAAIEYQLALNFKPELVESEIGLGGVLEVMNRPDEAIAHYQAALRLKPDSAHAHANLGVAFAKQGKAADAAEHFQTVVRLEPGNADAHYNLGNALMDQSLFSQAAEQYLEVLRLNPNDASAQRKLGLCRQRSPTLSKP